MILLISKIAASNQMLSRNHTVDHSRLFPKERFYQNYQLTRTKKSRYYQTGGCKRLAEVWKRQKKPGSQYRKQISRDS